jgi:(2Fe-2S) ferredoxin
LNAYGYCGGDPVNRVDPNGHWYKSFIKKLSKNIISSPLHPTKKSQKRPLIRFYKQLKNLAGKNLKKYAKTKQKSQNNTNPIRRKLNALPFRHRHDYQLYS